MAETDQPQAPAGPDTLPEIPKPKNINTPVGIGGAMPTSWGEIWQIACTVAASKVYGTEQEMTRERCALIIEAGLEHGLKTIQAFQYLKVINNRICLWGDAPLGLVKRSPEYVKGSHKEFMTGSMEAGDWTAHSIIQRVGEEPVERTFSMEQAKRAGLWMKRGKSYNNEPGAPTPWVTYPERMLQLRARALDLRDVFPDVLLGLSIAEEVEYIDVEARTETGETVGTSKPLAETPTTRLDATKAALKQRQADAAKGDAPPWEEDPRGDHSEPVYMRTKDGKIGVSVAATPVQGPEPKQTAQKQEPPKQEDLLDW